MSVVVLDSEPFSGLVRHSRRHAPGALLAVLTAALKTGADVVVPAAVLAELYRGNKHDAAVDAYLKRADPPVLVVSTDCVLAQQIGGLLARAGRSSADHVDATVVATAQTAGGGQALIVTGDPVDITALAAGLTGVTIEAV